MWLSHKKRKATYDLFASFTRFAKNIIWLSLHGNSFGRWAMFLTYVRIELTRAIVHGLRLNRSSEMVWGQRLSFLNYDVFAILFEEIYLPNIYSFRCAHSQPHIIDCGANIGAATAYFLTQHPDASSQHSSPMKQRSGSLSETLTRMDGNGSRYTRRHFTEQKRA